MAPLAGSLAWQGCCPGCVNHDCPTQIAGHRPFHKCADPRRPPSCLPGANVSSSVVGQMANEKLLGAFWGLGPPIRASQRAEADVQTGLRQESCRTCPPVLPDVPLFRLVKTDQKRKTGLPTAVTARRSSAQSAMTSLRFHQALTDPGSGFQSSRAMRPEDNANKWQDLFRQIFTAGQNPTAAVGDIARAMRRPRARSRGGRA